MRRQPTGTGPAEERRLGQVFLASEPRVELHIFGSAEELAVAAAAEFADRATAAVAQRGRFTVALSGGSTPNRLYALLAARPRTAKDRIPWGKVHVFWGDERIVPPAHSDSNFRAANEALLAKVRIPQANVHRIRTEARSPVAAAALYEQELRRFFAVPPGRFPRFDLVLLGLGADGHTASLFPGSDVLREESRLVAASFVARLGTHRITLTLPVLNNAEAVFFLVSGGQKAEALARALEGGKGSEALPPRLVRPQGGASLWFVDRAAARMLHRRTLRTTAL